MRPNFYFVLAMLAFILPACGGGSSAPPVAPSGPVNLLAADSKDWPQYRLNDQRTGDNASQVRIGKSNVATLALKWKAALPAGAFATPIVVNETVYQADMGGNISAIDESTGAINWSKYIEGAYFGTPTFNGGRLYAPNGDGNFSVLDAATGNVLWTYPKLDDVGGYQGSPIVHNGVVYEGRSNLDETSACETQGQMLSLDANGPTVLNFANLTPAGTTGVGIWSSPTMDAGGSLYLATGNSCSQASSPFGDAMIKMKPDTLNVYWKQQETDAHDLDFGATPILVNGMVVDSSKDGNVYAYDTATGNTLWKSNAGLPSASAIGSPATDGKHIFVPFNYVEGSLAGGALAALNLDGSVLWSLPEGAPEGPGFGPLSAPAVSNGVLYLGDAIPNCVTSCFQVSAYDADTGSKLWSFKLPGPVYGGVSIVDDGLFVAEFENGTLYCFTPSGK